MIGRLENYLLSCWFCHYMCKTERIFSYLDNATYVLSDGLFCILHREKVLTTYTLFLFLRANSFIFVIKPPSETLATKQHCTLNAQSVKYDYISSVLTHLNKVSTIKKLYCLIRVPELAAIYLLFEFVRCPWNVLFGKGSDIHLLSEMGLHFSPFGTLVWKQDGHQNIDCIKINYNMFL